MMISLLPFFGQSLHFIYTIHVNILAIRRKMINSYMLELLKFKAFVMFDDIHTNYCLMILIFK